MFDKKEAIKEYGITEEFYDGLLKEFLIQARNNLPILENSITAGDYKEAQSIIHSLKGAAGNLRVTSAYHIAITLENAVRTNKVQEINDNTFKLKTYIDELCLELKI
jgi:two-component system, sensor histidine kinase and response regulator